MEYTDEERGMYTLGDTALFSILAQCVGVPKKFCDLFLRRHMVIEVATHPEKYQVGTL